MSKATLKRILAHAKANPTLPVAKRKKGTGRKAIIQPAGGGAGERWECHQVLGSGPVHQSALFRPKNRSKRDYIT